jgi:hypothetical protein
MNDDLDVGIEQTYKNEKLLRFISFVLGCLLTIGILCISSKYNNDFFTLTIKETSSHRFIRKTLSKITGESNDLHTKWGIERENRRKVKEIEDGILKEHWEKQEELKQEYDEKVGDLKLEKEKSSNQLKIEFDKEKQKLDIEKSELLKKEEEEIKKENLKLRKEHRVSKDDFEKELKRRKELHKKFRLIFGTEQEQVTKKIIRRFKKRKNEDLYKRKEVELKRKYKFKEDKLDYKIENLLRELKSEFDENKLNLRIKKQQLLKSDELKKTILEQKKEVDRLNRVLFKKDNFNKKLSYVFWVLLGVGGFYLSWFYRVLVSKLMIKIGLNTQHHLRSFIERI